MPGSKTESRNTKSHFDCVRWSVSTIAGRTAGKRYQVRCPSASNLENGSENHDRFGHSIQQRARDDRGPLAFQRAYEQGAGRDSSTKHRAFDGGICGWFDSCPIEFFRYVFPNPIRGNVAGSSSHDLKAASFVRSGKTRI